MTNESQGLGSIPTPNAKPFFKFAGGKGRLLKRLIPLIPRDFEAYHEPFLGGGAVFFALSSDVMTRDCAGIARAWLGDVNEEIVAAFRAVRDEPEQLALALREHEGLHSKDHYLAARALDPAMMLPTSIAARFMYLNRAGYNGLYRVNRAGKCNVPWGKREKVAFDYENLKQCSAALKGVNVYRGDYGRVTKHAEEGDLVYLDSPYEGTFDAYSPKPFRGKDHAELASVAKELADRGCSVVISAADTPAARARYEGWDFVEFGVRRSVSRDGRKRAVARELVIRSPNLAGYRRPE